MASHSVPPGAVLASQYRVLEPLGEGGMGVVYVVEQVSTGAKRALKLMRPELLEDARSKERFVQEARIGAAIHSDHVVQVLDAGFAVARTATPGTESDRKTPPRPYIVMELLSGQSLSDAVTKGLYFNPAEIVEIFRQLCHALAAAHAVPIVHRDIKPENIFLAKSRSATFQFMVKVLDFGIAKMVAEANKGRTQSVGTPHWMPPEQMATTPNVTPAADIWPLGLIAFYLLTGKHYWVAANGEDENTAAVLREVCIDPLVPASERAAQYGVAELIPPGFDAWFARCVDRDVVTRFSNVEEVFDGLSTVMESWDLQITAENGVPKGFSAAFSQATPAPSSSRLLSGARASQPRLEGGSGRVSSPEVNPAGAAVTGVPTGSASVGAPAAPQGPTPPRSRVPLVAGGAAIAVIGLGLFAVAGKGIRSREPAGSASITALAPPQVSAGAASGDAVAGNVVLRLHGSNTIGSELGPALVEGFLKKKGATDIRVFKKPKEETTVVVGTMPGEVGASKVEIVAHGSGTAFTGLETGKCDIGMSSRRIKAEEATKLERLGNMKAASAEHVVAIDGIAVIVHRANPLTTLTMAEIEGLFSGKIANWADIKGGASVPVKLHARDDKSGTFDTFKSLALGKSALATTAKRYEDSAQLADEVAQDPGAVGFVGLPYVRSTKAVSVSEAGGRPLFPNLLTVRTEDYPLTRRLFFYASPTAASPLVSQLIDFAESGQGQTIVQNVGFVGLVYDGNEQAAAPCTGCSPEYAAATKGATRLPLNFRFQSNSSDLDNRSLRDVERLFDLMSAPDRAKRQMLLLGFTDNRGAGDANRDLSTKRAGIVAEALRQRGLNPALVNGFGDQMPVASNDTDAGRDKNRRVEIWLR